VAATDVHLGRRLAIKFLRRNDPTETTAAARFLREARTVASLRGDHVCRLLDYGQADGVPFYAMELLAGATLNHHLVERGRLPAEEACELLLQTCDAIGEAHLAGIVHRDLKPSNLFLAERPGGGAVVKVLDFGVAKALIGSGEHTLTDAHTMLGTPLYASPEQLQNSRDVDARTDVWALGVILYELLAGWPPFSARDVKRLVAKVCRSEPHPLRAIRPDVCPELEAIVRRCLAKHRDSRFANAGELGLELTRLMPHSQGRFERLVLFARAPSRCSSTPAPGPSSPEPDPLPRAKAPSLDPHTTTGRGSGTSSRAGRLWWIAVASVTVVGAVAVLRARRSPESGTPTATFESTRVETAASSSAGQKSRVRVAVSVDPPAAAIHMDGVPVPGNPFTALVPRSEQPHRIVASLSGYVTEERVFRFDRDLVIQLSLSLAQQGSPSGARLETAQSDPPGQATVTGSSPVSSDSAGAQPRQAVRRLDSSNPFARATPPTQ
jgi:serine/threonine-protein kinase